jgi:predicted translin family RNA/ssDNA-binding protein
MVKKASYDKVVKICSTVFFENDYNDFLRIIEGQEEIIQEIDLTPIKNYTHSNISLNGNYELFAVLYQHIKYYLEKKNMYEPKLQEGMALCASKAAIMKTQSTNGIIGYIDSGDKVTMDDKCNPFEEISRLLLITLREDPNTDFFVQHQKDILSTQREVTLFYETIRTALSKRKSKRAFNYYITGNIADLIGENLENSLIDSKNPLSATKKENAEALNEQFDIIYDLYETNITLQDLFDGNTKEDFKEKYLTRFQNKIIHAKRNIGIYQKTKQLTK